MTLYASCYDLPLSRFIRCMCDEDYTALVIEGEAQQEELTAAWQKIYQEYIELSGNQNENYELTLTLEINRLFFRYTVAAESVNVLRKYRYDDLVKLLKTAGYNFPFNHNDVEAYHNDLDRVLNRSKSILIEMENKQSQLNLLQKGKKGEKITRPYFDQILVVLSKFAQYHIDEEKTTVSRYVTTLNLYVKHCEQLNAKNV